MNPHLPLIHTLLHNSLLAALIDVESYSHVVELRVLSSRLEYAHRCLCDHRRDALSLRPGRMYCIQEFERQRAIIVIEHATLQWRTQHMLRAKYTMRDDRRVQVDSSPFVIRNLNSQIQREHDARVASMRRVREDSHARNASSPESWHSH